MKKIRRMLPLSTSDISGMERWLEEQANSGLFPISIGSWATFTTNGVPGTRFRLEPYGKCGNEPTEEQMTLYRLNWFSPYKDVPLNDLKRPYIEIQAIENTPVYQWNDLFEDPPFRNSQGVYYANVEYSLLAQSSGTLIHFSYVGIISAA